MFGLSLMLSYGQAYLQCLIIIRIFVTIITVITEDGKHHQSAAELLYSTQYPSVGLKRFRRNPKR